MVKNKMGPNPTKSTLISTIAREKQKILQYRSIEEQLLLNQFRDTSANAKQQA